LRFTNYISFFAISGFGLLTACQQPGADLAANVYQADQVNQSQDAKIINILSLSPAKIEVSNAQNQRTAQVVGGLLGAVGGGLLGGNVGNGSAGNVVGGAALGGIGGAAAGSLVPGQVLVSGVTIGYTEAGALHTSTQVGEMCQFQMGQAMVVTTQANETRVQPNAVCPTKPGGNNG
jgi:outer membrane lipoprotein SlyB